MCHVVLFLPDLPGLLCVHAIRFNVSIMKKIMQKLMGVVTKGAWSKFLHMLRTCPGFMIPKLGEVFPKYANRLQP